ncbi:MAG: hypothetical protein JXB05_04390 [Myxococcaceae bacterium]|nr:hypothetical protein [Myxococcaceae bacterium]
MSTFLESILAFPTVFLTILLGVVLTYWLCVILGAVGVDVLDGDAELTAGAKAASGALEGGAKAMGGLVGGAKAAGGALEGADVGGADGGHDAETSAGLLAMLGFSEVPLTISSSLVVFTSWTISFLARGLVFDLLGAALPGVVLSGGLLLLSLLLGTFLAALAVRPLRPLFRTQDAPGREALMGRVCTINSGSVTNNFGHATFNDGGAGLILNVFCDSPNQLKRGDQALILGYDPARDVYEVEPVDWLLPEELAQIQDPARAVAIAARARDRTR